jgi:hypothetical protein
MPRRRSRGWGGQPIPGTGSSEEEEVGGSMGDNHDEVMLQILKDLVRGQNEASQRQAETTRFQQQTLEVLTQLVSQRGST